MAGRERGIAAVFLVAAAVIMALSLISYNPDGRATKAGEPRVSNYAGLAGQNLAWAMVWAAGSVAFGFPAILLLCSYRLLRRRDGGGAAAILVSSLALCASVAALLKVGFASDPLFGGVAPGGRAGLIFGGFLLRYFSLAGSLIIIAAVAVASLIVIAPISLASVSADYLLGLYRSTGAVLGRLVRPVERDLVAHPKRGEPGEERQSPKWLDDLPVLVAPTDERRDRLVVVRATGAAAAPAAIEVSGGYRLPSLSLLDDPPPFAKKETREDLAANADSLARKLRDFGVEGRVVQVLPGPVVTIYEFEPASGVKVNRIVNLSDDLALGMKAMSVRIIAPVPGKAVVGIEIPNRHREPVYLKEIIAASEFGDSKSRLTMALGKDVLGRPATTDLSQIPHLLIAGATGSGKSVSIHAMICSLLFKLSPEEVRLLLIDPKMLEFCVYEGIPHLLAPVVTNPKTASTVLRVVVNEMERRNRLLAAVGVRNIEGFNKLINGSPSPIPLQTGAEPERMAEAEEEQRTKLPYIVVVIDELADLMLVSSQDVEDSIARLAQMARAAGIHLLLATQRPSVDVLTGVIKANFPARISFQLSSRTDSRTILDTSGAEKLLGKGDLLFLPPGTSRLQRIHGAYVSEEEIKRLVEHLKDQLHPEYDPSFSMSDQEEDAQGMDGDKDEKYDEAVSLVRRYGQASISMIQRRRRVGYNRAARMIEMMEQEGIIGPPEGVKPRRINPPLN